MSDIDLVDIKSLLHFDNLLKDEINIETWSKEKTSVTSGDITKFGHGSLYSNTGALLGTNTSGMWSLNSNGSYEIEFFVYPVAHGGTRKLFRLMEQDNSSPIFMLSLTKAGYLEFTATGWDITNALIGTTILAITTWHHVLIRASNQTITIFLDAVEEVSSDLPDNIILNVQQVMLGYFSTSSFNYYIDEFIFRHSAENGTPSIPTSPCVITSSSEPVFKNTKSLLHFDELCKDEIGLESWTKENTNVMLFDFAKFGYGSLYSNKGALLGTNTSGMWSLKSNGNYEIEFFVYPVAHGGTRYFFRLMSGSTTLLNLSLNTNGTVNFACSTFGCSGLNGSTVLTIQEWYHIMLRISNKTAKVFINGIEDITTDLLENKGLAPTQARVGYFDTSRGSFCMDEFLFGHSAGTGTPIIPTSPYTFCAYQFHQKRKFPSSIKSLFHFDYPYFNEPNDGLEDEIGLESWTKYGNIALYGSEIPNTGTLAPKFGYRCLCTYNGYIYCDSWNRSGIWNINSSGRYEIEFFVQFDNVANTPHVL